MSKPFKMKGSPMQRNFEVGSPAKQIDEDYNASGSDAIKNMIYNIDNLRDQGVSEDEIDKTWREVHQSEKDMNEEAEINAQIDRENFSRLNKTNPNMGLGQKIKRSEEMTDKQWDIDRTTSGGRVYGD